MSADEKPSMLPPGVKPLEMGSTFVKWEKVGQSMQGRILRMELSKKYGKGEYVLQIRQPDGKIVAVSAPLLLKEAVENHGLVGKTVAIVFADTSTTPNGSMKIFEVGIIPNTGEEDDTPF